MKENNGKKKISWLRYKLDQAFAGGTGSQLVALLVVIAIIVVAFGFLIGILFQDGNVITGMALTLKHLSSTNALISDFGSVNAAYFFIMLLVSLIGIGFYGTFIGIITSSIRDYMNELSKGHSKIIEEGHVVVLGFSGDVKTIVEEMTESNENWAGNKSIVVVDDMDKGKMEDHFKNVPHLLFRSGNPSLEKTLDTASVEKARAIIINNGDDFDVIRNMLALITYLKKCDVYMNEKMPVITVLMHDKESISSAKIAAGIHHDFDNDERNPYEDKIRILFVNDILAHLFAQACRQPGLSWVISEICDYGGAELYIEDTSADGKSLDDVFAGKTFGEINDALEKSIALGIQRNQDIILNPDPDAFRFEKGDRLIHLADDDKEIITSGTSKKNLIGEPAILQSGMKNDRLHFLVLGWNGTMPIILDEINTYCKKGSNVKIFTNSSDVSDSYENLDVSIDHIDPYKWDNIMPYLEDHLLHSKDAASKLTNIIIVGEDGLSDAAADKKEVTVLLHVREYLKDKNLEQQVTVTSEMNLPLDQYLLSQANSNDFIVGSQIASRILVQISNNPKLQSVFMELLSDEGSEFYLRSFDKYVDTTKPFNFNFVQRVAADKIKLGPDKQEIAIGWMRKGDAKSNTIINLNPSMKERAAVFKFAFDDDTFDNYRLIVVAYD